MSERPPDSRRADPRLLERGNELAALRDATVRAAERPGSVVLVAGEAGIGKSSLIRAWLEDPGADARTLVGWCDDLRTSRTLGPFRDIARQAGGPLSEAVAAADTAAVFETVLALLDQPLRPTVLVLEDLHWADEATLDVVRYVGRRIETLRAVLALSYRDDELGADHPLRSVVSALPSRQVQRLSPQPLSLASVTALTQDTPMDAAEVLRVTGGNPFFVSEVVAGRGGVPATVADAIRARLRTLPAEVREVVEQLSVIPRPDRGLSDELGATPQLLSMAEQRGLLVLTGDSVGFRHELARRAIQSTLTASLRRHYHERALALLLARGDDAPAILHQAVEAGRGDVIVRYGPEMAEQAVVAGAHREALQHQNHVLEHAELLDPATHAALLEQHAWTLYSLHRMSEAAAAADRAVELRSDLHQPTERSRALLTQSRMHWIAGDRPGALASFEAAARCADDHHDTELDAEVALHQLALDALTGRHDDVLDVADRAFALTRSVGRHDLEALVHCYLGKVRVSTGDPAGADSLIAGIELARASGALEAAARCYANLATHLVAAGSWDEAEHWTAEALDFLDDHDFVSHRYNVEAQQALLGVYRGRWESADATLRRLLASVEQPGVLENLAIGGLAVLAVRRGAHDAGELAERAWQLATRAGAAHYLGPAAVARVEHAWLTASGRLEVIVDEALGALLDRFRRSAVLRTAARAGLAIGSDEEIDEPYASGIAGRFEAAAHQWHQRGEPYEEGLELFSTGEPDALLQALQIFDRLGARPAAELARRRLRTSGVRRIPRGPQDSTRRHPAGLTERQAEVLQLLIQGLTNPQIAERLVVSVRTVDHHVAAILQKLGVGSRHEAVARAATLERQQ
jgi:ATP/maltotriose-dependent transcriptional regulator MalT